MLNQVVPTFLYPTSRKYLFDELCERIVRELEKRNWRVPGITVEFDIYGSGLQKMQIVREVSGPDFKLRFGRPQKLMPGGRWYDVAAISDLYIPGFELSVYSDDSEPRLIVYVGKDWETDKQWFFHSSKVNSKLYGEPRRYLLYKGRNTRSLVHDNDLGREYDPRGQEPHEYGMPEVFMQFRKWLEANVLAVILQQPEQEFVVSQGAELVPFPANLFPKIYTRVEPRRKDHIKRGQTDINSLAAAERYALVGGRRLLTFSFPDDGTLLPEVYDGFLWCVTDRMSPGALIDDILEEVCYASATEVVQIVPATADGVYVIDWAVQDEFRQRLLESDPKIKTMNDAQYAEFKRTLARTFVPVSRYTGGYRDPLILISRELDFHEVKLLDAADQSGPAVTDEVSA